MSSFVLMVSNRPLRCENASIRQTNLTYRPCTHYCIVNKCWRKSHISPSRVAIRLQGSSSMVPLLYLHLLSSPSIMLQNDSNYIYCWTSQGKWCHRMLILCSIYPLREWKNGTPTDAAYPTNKVLIGRQEVSNRSGNVHWMYFNDGLNLLLIDKIIQ